MIAFKFLGPGSVGLFSRLEWPVPGGGRPGGWVEAGGPLEECRTGVHACGPWGLIDWLDSELWHIELDEPIVETDAGFVAGRGRLLRRVEAWDGRAAGDLARACVERARDRGAEALERAGRAKDAAGLRALADPERIGSRATELARGTPPEIADPLGFAADAVTMARGGMPDSAILATLAPPTAAAIAANVAFTAARAAGRAHELADGPGGFNAGYDAERTWQREWLCGRLSRAPETGVSRPGPRPGRPAAR